MADNRPTQARQDTTPVVDTARPDVVPDAPEPDETPQEKAGTSAPHREILGGPSGAAGWCEGCQQYCGGTNPQGDEIRCANHPD